MKSIFPKFLGIALLQFILFLCMFSFLQDKNNYDATLGKVSYNVERVHSKNGIAIQKSDDPYQQIEEEKFHHWDANFYRCVRDDNYQLDKGCVSTTRGAVFPLFSYFWKILDVDSAGISIVNYLLFVCSIGILIYFFLPTSTTDKLLIFALLTTLPSAFPYIIPYSESTFLFIGTLTAVLFLKKQNTLALLACILLVMTRPAALFVLTAIGAVEFISWLVNKDFRKSATSFSLKTMAFAIGIIIVLFIQYASSGSWTTFLDAHARFNEGFRPFHVIIDWSKQGFSLNTFAIFMICIPTILFAGYSFIRRKDFYGQQAESLLNDPRKNYLFLVSAFYIIGIFVHRLYGAGGNLHSTFRYIMASPAFYIFVLYLLAWIHQKEPLIKTKLKLLVPFLALLMLFLLLAKYGGDRISFHFLGLYLSIAITLFLAFRAHLPLALQIGIVTLCVFLNLLWHTYLFNLFLSNNWIVT